MYTCSTSEHIRQRRKFDINNCCCLTCRPVNRNLAVKAVNKKMAEASLSCSYTDMKQSVEK
jgi:hypothetical protein